MIKAAKFMVMWTLGVLLLFKYAMPTFYTMVAENAYGVFVFLTIMLWTVACTIVAMR